MIEIHPEVSFTALCGEPLESKKTPAGIARRRVLLADAGISLQTTDHNTLDAAVAAWSADRYARGDALPLPDGHTERIGAIWR